jgi:hypothetical protein
MSETFDCMKFTEQGKRGLQDEFDRFRSDSGSSVQGDRGRGESVAAVVYVGVQVQALAGSGRLPEAW